jgi:hypothetical protein
MVKINSSHSLMEVTKDESYLDEVTFLNNKFVEVESK